MKPKFLLCLALVLGGGLTASAYMADIPVTTNNLDQGTYVFSVSNNAAQGGKAFHITITSKQGDFSPYSLVWLDMKHEKNVDSIQPESLKPQITLKKDDHTWKVDFIASNELMKRPDICFIFEEIPYVIGPDGKRPLLGGGSFYEIKLWDFLKAQNCEYKSVQRLDYPGLNNNGYSSLYAFPWRTQLKNYEQQGWIVDSVSFKEEGLASGHPVQAAIIVLKRVK